jgi:hypothetical protein
VSGGLLSQGRVDHPAQLGDVNAAKTRLQASTSTNVEVDPNREVSLEALGVVGSPSA